MRITSDEVMRGLEFCARSIPGISHRELYSLDTLIFRVRVNSLRGGEVGITGEQRTSDKN
jgi:hypothetical protein